MKIATMVRRKNEIEKYCCICGNKNAQILHNYNNPFVISFICKKCRADKSKLAQAEKLRFDIREIMDKSKISSKNFSEKDVMNLVENYLFEKVSITDYCKEIGISYHIFSHLIERYKLLFDKPNIKKVMLNHSNALRNEKLSAVALERYRVKNINAQKYIQIKKYCYNINYWRL